jgi:hypothetical protein
VKAILTLLNDYRDTIYYTLALVSCSAGAYFDNPLEAAEAFLQLIWLREIARWVTWFTFSIKDGHHFKVAYYHPVIGSFVLMASTIIWLIRLGIEYHEAAAWWNVACNCINMTFIAVYVYQRGLRRIPKIWWRDLFDWPRKQKPPGRRIEKAAEAGKRLMQKIADAMPAPSPVPEGARLIQRQGGVACH